MVEQLITFNTAKSAKEKGYTVLIENIQMYGSQNIPQLEPYNETRWVLYKDYCLAPTQSLLQKWLRDVHKIFVLILHDGKSFYYQIQRPEWDNCITNFELNTVFTYEEALENGLLEALKMI